MRVVALMLATLPRVAGWRAATTLSAAAAPAGALPLIPTYAPAVLSVPVYSLATLDADDDTVTNMNILTYASPVGIRPNRVWCVSLYRGTRSHENFAARGWGVLQLLRPAHAELVRPLGGASGRDISKADACAELGFAWRPPTMVGTAGAGAGGVTTPGSVAALPSDFAYATLQKCLANAGVSVSVDEMRRWCAQHGPGALTGPIGGDPRAVVAHFVDLDFMEASPTSASAKAAAEDLKAAIDADFAARTEAAALGLSGPVGGVDNAARASPLLLPGCASYFRIDLMSPMTRAGDHDVAMCSVSLFFNDGSESPDSSGGSGLLETAALRDKGIITALGKVAP